jgi:branched-chain amino acid transport system substrate-binding protein
MDDLFAMNEIDIVPGSEIAVPARDPSGDEGDGAVAPPERGPRAQGGVHVLRRVKKTAAAMALVAGSAAFAGALSSAMVPATPAAAASPSSPVTVADLCSCTGPEASTISQTTATMQAWASWVNSHGGLAGHQVHLSVLDDGYSAAKALANAQTAISQDHAVAIFDNSDEDPSFASLVQGAHVPVLGGQETTSGWQNSDFFPPGASFNYTNSVGAIVAKDAGVKKEAALYCVEVAICQQSVQAGKAVGAHYGIQYVYTAGIGFAAPNYTAQCLAAKQSGATAMTVGDASSIVEHVVQDCAAQDYTPRQLSSDGTVASAWLTIPAFNGNIDTQSDFLWFVHDAATKTMYAALDKYAPQVPSGPNFGEVVLQSWVDGALLQAAVQAAGATATTSITSPVILKGLYGLPAGETLGGLSPPLHFTKGQPANNSCFFEMGIEHGKFVVLHGGTTICGPLVKAGTQPSS